MPPVVAILAAGNMGAGIARRLHENGVTVLTCLEGRGAATKERATAAGFVAVALEDLVTADLFLSVVPPAVALATAAQIAPHLGGRKQGFVLCRLQRCQPRQRARGRQDRRSRELSYLDAAIIGAPPRPGVNDTVLYVSGAACAPLLALNAYGLDVRELGPEIGAASALKMSYAGITKGLTGLAAAMMLGATREGAEAALYKELQRSQPGLLSWFERQVPGMIPKAYRWDAEMEEIAAFLAEDAAAAQIFQGMARFYRRIAEDAAHDKVEGEALIAFLKRAPIKS